MIKIVYLAFDFPGVYWNFLKSHTSISVLIHSVLFYMICYFSALVYYQNWGVDFSVIADVTSIAGYFIKHPLYVLSLCAFIALVAINFFHFILTVSGEFDRPEFKSKYSGKLFYAFRFAMELIILTSIVASIYLFSSRYFAGYKDVADFNAFNATLYSVSYTEGVIDCVKPLGLIGDFYIFKELDFSTVYLSRGSVLKMKETSYDLCQNIFDISE